MEGTPKKVKDPVCLMEIDPALAVDHEDYQGTRFYFCAENCQKAFQQDPERYAKQAA
jgi:Cu+-exporting ATPase